MNFSIKELNELIYSLGTASAKGMMCDKELNASLLDKLYGELNSKIVDEEPSEKDEWFENNLHMATSFPIIEPFSSNLSDIDNEYLDRVLREENAYATSLGLDESKKERGWITQAILDYVDTKGSATYKELNNYYKNITGSNSFSHHVYNLIVPYKNRPTRRYLVKNSDGKYEIRIATIHNWVELDKDYH